MAQPNFIILFVDNPQNSASFYSILLGKEAVEASSTFAMFALDSGLMLGLWSKHTAEPLPTATGGGCELAISVESEALVDKHYAQWSQWQVEMLQTPAHLDFGYTFLARDPDGHRLRVFCPS